MEQAQEPPREQRFDLQQMLRELAVEAACGDLPAPSPRPAGFLAGREHAHAAHGVSPQGQQGEDRG